MKKGYRILLALAVTLVMVFVSTAVLILIFDRESPKLAAVISLSAGALTYRLIKPSVAEIQEVTKMAHVYHENGIIKEKGKIIAGRREGAWEFFDETGAHVETKNYSNGKEV